jgi:hypothetical protein
MLLSGRPLADSLPPVVPDRRAVHFALAFLPIGIATSLLHIIVLRYGVPALLAPLPADETQWPAGLLTVVRPVLALLGAPTLQWLVAGLALAPLALRLLHLPAVAGTAPSARPTLGLAGMLLAAIVLGNLIEYAPTTLLPGAGPAAAPVIAHAVILLGWYAGTFVMTLLIASSVAALLWRRSRRVDPPSP